MNIQEEKYIRASEHRIPSIEVFERMDQILVNLHEQTDLLMARIEDNLLNKSTVTP